MAYRQKIKRTGLQTESYQITKEKLRQFESAQFMGEDIPLPTRMKLTKVITRHVDHIRVIKTAKSA